MPRLENKYCHQCHTKKDVVRCDNEKCAKGYCGHCIDKYGTERDELLLMHTWTCFGCRNECQCTQCRRRTRAPGEAPPQPVPHPRTAAVLLSAATSAAETAEPVMNGPLTIIRPNIRAKPFVPSRVGAASSGFRGVSKQGQRWRARICIDKVEYTVGDFETEEAAARAYDLEAIRRGKLRALNFIYKDVNDYLLQQDAGDPAIAASIAAAAAAAVASTAAPGAGTYTSSSGGGGGSAWEDQADALAAWQASARAHGTPLTGVGASADGHDEICTMCFVGGDLVCCDVCPRVFHHQKCLRPEDLPTSNDTWRCPVCTGQLLPPRHPMQPEHITITSLPLGYVPRPAARVNAAAAGRAAPRPRSYARSGARTRGGKRGRGSRTREDVEDMEDTESEGAFSGSDDDDVTSAAPLERLMSAAAGRARYSRSGRRIQHRGRADYYEEEAEMEAVDAGDDGDGTTLLSHLLDDGGAPSNAAGGSDEMAAAAAVSTLMELGGGSSAGSHAHPPASAFASSTLQHAPIVSTTMTSAGMAAMTAPSGGGSMFSMMGISPSGFSHTHASSLPHMNLMNVTPSAMGGDSLTSRLLPAPPVVSLAGMTSSSSSDGPLSAAFAAGASSAAMHAAAGSQAFTYTGAPTPAGAAAMMNTGPRQDANAGHVVPCQQYSQLLVFLHREDVASLLTQVQRRKVKQLVVAGGPQIIQLLLSAMDVFETTNDGADLVDSFARIYSLWIDASRMYGMLPMMAAPTPVSQMGSAPSTVPGGVGPMSTAQVGAAVSPHLYAPQPSPMAGAFPTAPPPPSMPQTMTQPMYMHMMQGPLPMAPVHTAPFPLKRREREDESGAAGPDEGAATKIARMANALDVTTPAPAAAAVSGTLAAGPGSASSTVGEDLPPRPTSSSSSFSSSTMNASVGAGHASDAAAHAVVHHVVHHVHEDVGGSMMSAML